MDGFLRQVVHRGAECLVLIRPYSTGFLASGLFFVLSLHRQPRRCRQKYSDAAVLLHLHVDSFVFADEDSSVVDLIPSASTSEALAEFPWVSRSTITHLRNAGLKVYLM
jgi:hypothetical protein